MLQVHAHLVPISLQHIGFATAAPVRRPVQLTFLPTGLYRRQRERDRFKFGVLRKRLPEVPRMHSIAQGHTTTRYPSQTRSAQPLSMQACLNDRQIESAPMLSPARRGDKNNGTLHTFKSSLSEKAFEVTGFVSGPPRGHEGGGKWVVRMRKPPSWTTLRR